MKSLLRLSTAFALAALVGCSQNQQRVAPQANDTPQKPRGQFFKRVAD